MFASMRRLGALAVVALVTPSFFAVAKEEKRFYRLSRQSPVCDSRHSLCTFQNSSPFDLHSTGEYWYTGEMHKWSTALKNIKPYSTAEFQVVHSPWSFAGYSGGLSFEATHPNATSNINFAIGMTYPFIGHRKSGGAFDVNAESGEEVATSSPMTVVKDLPENLAKCVGGTRLVLSTYGRRCDFRLQIQ